MHALCGGGFEGVASGGAGGEGRRLGCALHMVDVGAGSEIAALLRWGDLR